MNLVPSCSPRQDESSDTQFEPKRSISKFDPGINLESQVKWGQSGSYLVSFDSGPWYKRFDTTFNRLPPLVQKLLAEK